MSTKQCKKCGETKPRSAYYAEKNNRDGLKGSCETCFKQYRAKNKEAISAYSKAWRKTAAGRACKQRSRNSTAGKASARRYRESTKGKATIAAYVNNPEHKLHQKAQHAVGYAIKIGRMVRGLCAHHDRSLCSGPIHGHHWSYEKCHWLDVIWLCTSHHKLEHLSSETSESTADVP